MNKEDNSKIYSKDKITFHELEDNTSATRPRCCSVCESEYELSELEKLMTEGLIRYNIGYNLEPICVWAHNGEPVKLDDDGNPIYHSKKEEIDRELNKQRENFNAAVTIQKEEIVARRNKQRENFNAAVTIQKWWKKTRNSESLDFSEKACVDLLGKKSYDSLVQSFKNVNDSLAQTFKNVNKKYEIHKSLFLKFDTSSQPWMDKMRAARSRTLEDLDFMNWSGDDY